MPVLTYTVAYIRDRSHALYTYHAYVPLILTVLSYVRINWFVSLSFFLSLPPPPRSSILFQPTHHLDSGGSRLGHRNTNQPTDSSMPAALIYWESREKEMQNRHTDKKLLPLLPPSLRECEKSEMWIKHYIRVAKGFKPRGHTSIYRPCALRNDSSMCFVYPSQCILHCTSTHRSCSFASRLCPLAARRIESRPI